MIVELNIPVEIAELMSVLSWWLKTEPTLTPIMPPETYADAIGAEPSARGRSREEMLPEPAPRGESGCGGRGLGLTPNRSQRGGWRRISDGG
jgi:hypothetical protein